MQSNRCRLFQRPRARESGIRESQPASRGKNWKRRSAAFEFQLSAFLFSAFPLCPHRANACASLAWRWRAPWSPSARFAPSVGTVRPAHDDGLASFPAAPLRCRDPLRQKRKVSQPTRKRFAPFRRPGNWRDRQEQLVRARRRKTGKVARLRPTKIGNMGAMLRMSPGTPQ